MSIDQKEFGVLTLATESDHLKAIGLALSLRVSNPGVPVAIACSEAVARKVAPFFDHVVLERPGLRGFVHKVYLDHYSPFQTTLFLDSDVLVFKDLRPHVARWAGRPYCACGGYVTEGVSVFGLDRVAALAKIGKSRLVIIDGAGHAYFEAASCGPVFDAARELTANYREFAGDIRYADEDVMAIIMTKLDLPPVPFEDFFSRHLSAKPGTMKMDASKGQCQFVAASTGASFSPCMMHFAANEGAWDYTVQLFRLFRKFGAPTAGLLKQGIADWYTWNWRMPVSRVMQRARTHLRWA